MAVDTVSASMPDLHRQKGREDSMFEDVHSIISKMNRSMASVLDEEVSYEELFSLFDNAQEYFTANELKTEIRKAGTRNGQLVEKYASNLRDLNKDLSNTIEMNEVLRTKINDSERMYAELGDVLADLDDAYKELRVQLSEALRENLEAESSRSESLVSLSDRNRRRIQSKLSINWDSRSLSTGSLSNDEGFSDDASE